MIEKKLVWVHPSYQKKLKRMALDSDKTILELTRDLGKEGEPIIKRKGFKLGFP